MRLVLPRGPALNGLLTALGTPWHIFQFNITPQFASLSFRKCDILMYGVLKFVNRASVRKISQLDDTVIWVYSFDDRSNIDSENPMKRELAVTGQSHVIVQDGEIDVLTAHRDYRIRINT